MKGPALLFVVGIALLVYAGSNIYLHSSPSDTSADIAQKERQPLAESNTPSPKPSMAENKPQIEVHANDGIDPEQVYRQFREAVASAENWQFLALYHSSNMISNREKQIAKIDKHKTSKFE